MLPANIQNIKKKYITKTINNEFEIEFLLLESYFKI